MAGKRLIACVVWQDGTVVIYRGGGGQREELAGVWASWARALRSGVLEDWPDAEVHIYLTDRTVAGIQQVAS